MPFHLSLSDIVLIVLLVVFVFSEYEYRAKRDGSKEALRAMIFAFLVFDAGVVAQAYFGLIGLAGVLAILVLALIVLLVRSAVVERKSRQANSR